MNKLIHIANAEDYYGFWNSPTFAVEDFLFTYYDVATSVKLTLS